MCDQCPALEARIKTLEQQRHEAATFALHIDTRSTEAKRLLPVQTPEAAYHQGKADMARAVGAILRQSASDYKEDWLAAAQSPTYPKLGADSGKSAELLLAEMRSVLNRLASHLPPILQQHRNAPTEAGITVNIPLPLARELWNVAQEQ